MKNLTFYPTTEKIVTEDYPYGYKLRCKKYDWIEYKPKFGCRHVYQTTNPKAGDRLNKPKAGQYYPCMLLGENPENGHLESACAAFYGDEGINNGCKWLSVVGNYFTEEQRKYIFAYIWQSLVISRAGSIKFNGAKIEDIAPLYDYAIKVAKEGAESGDCGLFQEIYIDIPKVKAVEIPDFSPFKTINYGVIGS